MGIRDGHYLWGGEGADQVEEKMVGPQFLFSRIWGALRGKKEGWRRGIEFSFSEPHFHSFVFFNLFQFTAIFWYHV